MRVVGRGVVFMGLATALISVAAAGIAWWRWERIETVAGDIPLPPGSQIVRRIQAPGSAEGEESCTFVVRSHKRVGSLREFYRRVLTAEGWELMQDTPGRMKGRKPGRVLRLVFHQERKRAVFTLNILPCTQH